MLKASTGMEIMMKIIENIWLFLQDQLLGMQWLNVLIGNTIDKIGLNISDRAKGVMQFFIYDTIKIFVLLAVLIFIISYIQSFFPAERSKRIIGRFHGIWANVIGALLGTVTPFCSCSSIPIFMGFTSAGLPLDVTFSFLISSPMVDLGSLFLLMGIFGGKIAAAYVIVGLIIAIVGGTIIEKLHLQGEIKIFNNPAGAISEEQTLTARDRLNYSKEQVYWTVKKVAPYIFAGVAIGAVIHNIIPQAYIEGSLGGNKWYSVLIATIAGVPVYADIFGTIPIAEGLLTKGAGLGTILSFMMAVTTLSLPSIIMLSKAIKPKLMSAFIAIVTGGIIIVGYIFNAAAYLFI